jgi:GNAT superfamily N-acetyltransferase
MIELNETNYSSVSKFLTLAKFDTVFAHSIIEKRQKGRIFVDVERHPSVALFWHYCGMAVLSGDCNNTIFNTGIIDLLLRRFENNQKRISIGIDNVEWKLKIEDLLQSRLLYYSELENSSLETTEKAKSYVLGRNRLTHKFNVTRFKASETSIKTPEKYRLRKINKEILPKIFGRVIPSFSWDSAQAFLEGGTGYCLIDGDKFACSSISSFIGNGQIDIGIETNPEYRRQGLGAPTAAAMVRYCLEHGHQPVWGCLQDNVGSALIAKKVGFDNIGSHLVYFSLAE